MGLSGAAYYQGVLEALYDAIEALDVAGYRDPTTTAGRWRRARRAQEGRGITEDLGFWVDLGNEATFERSQVSHSAGVVFAVRYRPGQDLADQARLHAAVRDLSELLQRSGWQVPGGMRTIPRSAQMTLPAGGGDAWLQVDLAFTLVLPRGD